MNLKFHPYQDTTPGNVINELSIAVDIILDQLLDLDLPLAKRGFQIDYAKGTDLEALASFLDIKKEENESDASFRSRIYYYIGTRIPVTVDAIQDLFEVVTGLRPVIQEDFLTRVFTSGQSKPTGDNLAEFAVHFNADITQVVETVYVNADGESVTVGHTTNIDDEGTIAAYDHDNDPSHETDISDTIDADTGIMTITGGPYIPTTQIDIEYEIVPNIDYDTLKELYDDMPLFQSLVRLVKASGVKVGDIKITKLMKELFLDVGTQTYYIRDIFSISMIQFSESLNLIFRGWDVVLWNYSNWDAINAITILDVIGLFYSLDGAVADDGGSQTTETTAANDNTIDDMSLLPVTPAVDDAYYIGGDLQFPKIRFDISTAGDGVWTIIFEYSKGSSTWDTLSIVTDNTNGFRKSGINDVVFNMPSDWATDTVNSITNKYWIRARVSAYTSVVTQPKGKRAHVGVSL